MSSTAVQRRDATPARPAASRAPALRLAGDQGSPSGAVQIHSLEDVVALAETFARSGVFQDVRDASQAVAKILYGAEMGFSPIASMQGVYLVKGKLALSAGLVAAAIRRHPRYDYAVVEHTDDACSIAFFDETGGEMGTSSFSARDAKRAGTQNMGKFPRNMLFARALTNGARWYCPDVFGGPVYTPEELGQEVDGEGEPVGLESAEVLDDGSGPDGRAPHPSLRFYGGDEPARQLPEAAPADPASAEPPADPEPSEAARAVERLEARVDEVGLEPYGLTALLAKVGAVRPGDLTPDQVEAAIATLGDAEKVRLFNADGFVRQATARIKAAPEKQRAAVHDRATEAAGEVFGGALLDRVRTALDKAAGLPIGPDDAS